MRKQIKIKQLVAILLPIVFILGIVYAIPNMISLRADDSSSQLTVQKGDEDITGKEISISDTEVKLKLTAKKNQLYQLPKNEKLSVSSTSSDSRDLPIREVTSSDFDLEKELTDLKDGKTDKDKSRNELIRVIDTEANKSKLYLKLLKDQSETMIFARESTSDEISVEVENVEAKNKQKLFDFTSPKVEEPTAESESKEEEKAEEPAEEEDEQSEPLKGDETLEELEERKYSKAESFKPIELPLEETTSNKGTKATPSVNVTNAKLKVRSGTEDFDGSKDGGTHPGYDKNDTNEWVRTFDSSIYILSFSIEGSDPGVTYSDIKYRVDMELPNAEGFDTSGKKRNNFGIVTDRATTRTEEADKTKTENGYVESTIRSNGQVLLPIFVNVFGAQHNTKITPKLKITLISATNDKTGTIETLNKVYDENHFDHALRVPEKKVSAKASLTTTLEKGDTTSFADTISGSGWTASTRENWQVGGLGVSLLLKPLPGRSANDFRGSTFPVGKVSFTINTAKDYYYNKVPTTSDIPTTVYPSSSETDPGKSYPIHIVAGRSGSLDTTASDWQWNKHTGASRALKINDKVLAKDIPYGKSLKLLDEAPTDPDKSKIGVYDTGDVKIPTNTKVEISDYEPIWNPYTYNMSGKPVNKNTKQFASVSLLVEWSNLFYAKKTDSVKYYYSDINISNLSYESESHAGEGNTTFQVNTTTGSLSQHMLWVHPNDGENQGMDIFGNSTSWSATGKGQVSKGYKFDLAVRFNDEQYLGTGTGFTGKKFRSKEVTAYARWNANSAKYDLSRKPFITKNSAAFTYWFGVKKTSNPAPDRSSLSQTAMDSQYTWYTTQEAAVGEISAVKIYSKRDTIVSRYFFSISLPVIATGKVKSDSDLTGGRNIALYNTFRKNVYTDSTVQNEAVPPIGTVYEPTVFTSTGGVTTSHRARTGSATNTNHASTIGGLGDSFWTKGVGITTTTKPEKETYRTDEPVKWKITGNVSGGNVDHRVTMKTTIPKGLIYVSGSSVLGSGTAGRIISESSPVKNPDGSHTITWVIDKVNASKDIPEITFETKADVANLTFTDSSITEAEVTTVGEIYVTGSPSEKDDSAEFIRKSSGKVNLYQIQQISLEKSVVPDYIEVGDKDAGNPSLSTDIKYTIKLTNNSSDTLANVKVMDVLPYNGDEYGSTLPSGILYKVTGFKFIKGSGKVYHKSTGTSGMEKLDPNDVSTSGWSTYTPGGSVIPINFSKIFIVEKAKMEVDEELEFEITISPINPKAGEIFRNRVSFNSHLDLPVKSNVVETTVYGRDLTGFVWYDDDYDGLIGTKKDGTPEDPVGDIPVKLYRTSQENGSYKKQLVKQSLKGTAFVDGSGNSLVKTGTDGKYKFEDLPEGEYIAEFIVGDIVVTKKVVIVTKQLVGSDMTLNSKADPASPFRTPEKKSDGTPFYKQPILSDLPTLLTGTDKVFHIPDVNAGLTRLSKIKLFKYEEGTVFDKDGDGHLSDEEIEDTTYTRALAGAEFDIYKGKSDDPDPADKIDHQVTDSKGWLEFVGLPPGDYTIVETKAPAGFELIKKPIHVNVPTFNYVAVVHVGDSAQTKLPFTGSTKAARIVLIASATLCVIGMIGVFLQFRPTKTKGGR
ncbi:MAG: hypothetical protein L0M04_12260 [Enterococcus sp.]|uniref:SpaA isopeptide-forming pilin-related protein n=1 Tax=Enterococcus sp. TaxID=35783 RepID=UPI0026490C50|nr:SpaA isopeptide-forming pilin-related protein [Enterococcus sp.]MDN6002038.1 hypothetical protein [Enterococcus sp.]MDN6216334.1 hypothetical protein [Enterococcus sp.]MDN6561889.1 hypothetical protein [Enterococcus sp.]MDN6583150.1 hypothetical protein [Enterococcus sp.]MDN6647635.1 hypothetical protein [Enterococcus sp.]